MRTRLATTAALGAAVIAFSGASPALAGRASTTPTASQVRNAIRAAKRSSDLWATLNICRSHELGVRGQMPSLGFASGMFMTFDVYYFVTARDKFEPVPHTKERIYLGVASTMVHQGGYTFTFRKRATLAAEIEFTWKLHGKVIGSVRRATTGGHKLVDEGKPPGYSAAVCTLR